ncbi:SDR family oxidoreductase [Aeromicrobium sp. CTD01-1L150]|uniref:SDR family oxidoreductase n=1 Tax=Aeromicrobium sp. CTD01-1L150 TaxID=3341830 RepID=UPI0035C1C7A5
MRIVVAGASGVVGRHVVRTAELGGHDVVPLSRASGVDLTSGRGLVERLEGVDAVIDCLGPISQRAGVVAEFFKTTSGHLLEAGAEAGVGHHVTLSIVGIDEVPTGYYRGKLAQERAVRGSGRPATILRATQFHEFARQMTERARLGPLVMAPRMLSAPIAAAEVAEALVDLAARPPSERTLEIGGPEQLSMVDMVRDVARSDGLRAVVLPVPLPGGGPAARSGALVPRDPWRVGRQRFEEWLPTSRTGPAR